MGKTLSEFQQFMNKVTSPKDNLVFIATLWNEHLEEGMSLKGATNRVLTEQNGLISISPNFRILVLQLLILLNENEKTKEGNALAAQLRKITLEEISKNKKELTLAETEESKKILESLKKH